MFLKNTIGIISIAITGFSLIACDSDSGTSADDNGSTSKEECLEVAAQCPSDLKDDEVCDKRDGHVYKLVTVNGKTWFAENLNYQPCEINSATWCFNNDSKNCEKYGRLYTWTAAMGIDKSYQKSYAKLEGEVQGICPEGFHVPTSADWNSLTNFADEETGYESAALRSKTGWTDLDAAWALDSYGFAALPGGRKYFTGFQDLGKAAWFWTSDEDVSELGGNGINAMSRFIDSNMPEIDVIGVGSNGKDFGYSIRCVK